MTHIRIVSRNSKLALIQAQIVASQIHNLDSTITTEIIGVTTRGDAILDRSLSQIGGKGLFVKELEVALLENKADIAVHSLKDMPSKLSSEFNLAAIFPREDPSDAFVANYYKTLEDVPPGKIIGTSSVRRVAFLNKYYPHLEVRELRGNLMTRLSKLDNQEYDAILLATAGLKRLNLESRIRARLPINQFVPAIGQGAIAIEVLSVREDLKELCKLLNHEKTFCEISAEREVGSYLGANCGVPIAVYCTIEGQKIQIEAIVLDADSHDFYRAFVSGNYQDSIILAQECAQILIKQGVESILAKYRV